MPTCCYLLAQLLLLSGFCNCKSFLTCLVCYYPHSLGMVCSTLTRLSNCRNKTSNNKKNKDRKKAEKERRAEKREKYTPELSSECFSVHLCLSRIYHDSPQSRSTLPTSTMPCNFHPSFRVQSDGIAFWFSAHFMARAGSYMVPKSGTLCMSIASGQSGDTKVNRCSQV